MIWIEAIFGLWEQLIKNFFFLCKLISTKKAHSNLLLLIKDLIVYSLKHIREYHRCYNYDQDSEDYSNHSWKTDLLESFAKSFKGLHINTWGFYLDFTLPQNIKWALMK